MVQFMLCLRVCLPLTHADIALTPEKLVSLLDELPSLRTLVLEYCSELLETHDVSWCPCTQSTCQ